MRDLDRARVGLAREFAGQSRAAALWAGCEDAALRDILERTDSRKLAQAARLLAWLQERNGRPAPLDGSPETGRGASFDGKPEAGREAAEALPSTLQQMADTGQAAPFSVVELRPITADLLAFKVARPAAFRFTAGQTVKLELGGVRRSYSLVSAPAEPWLEFFVELVPGGAMSLRLRQLAVGTVVGVGSAKGGLVLDAGASQHLMIATVTGVNPFVSMLRHHLSDEAHGARFVLLHGASYRDEFGYDGELAALAARYPSRFVYLPTVSRPDEPRNAGWRGESGRVELLADRYLATGALDPATTRVYACGNPGMVSAVEARCATQGFRLVTERYY